MHDLGHNCIQGNKKLKKKVHWCVFYVGLDDNLVVWIKMLLCTRSPLAPGHTCD